MRFVVVATVAVVILVVLVAGSVVAGRRVADRWHLGTGREQWLQAARELSWGQRWTIFLAQSLGRPVRDPSLVEPARVRAQYGIAAGSRMLRPGSPWGRLRWLFVGSGILQMASGVFTVSTGLRVGWLTVVGGLFVSAAGIGLPRAMASSVARFQRSLDGTP